MTSELLDPKLFINNWRRYPEKLDFETPKRIIIGGKPGVGKSALLEKLGSKGKKIIDIFCSRDNEGVSWCRHSKFKNNVLFIHGDTVKISSQWDEAKISRLKLQDFETHQTVISVPAFYSNLREEFGAIDRMMRIIWYRNHWKEIWHVLVREATSLLYSRLTVGENQAQAKAIFIYALKEFRHCGCTSIIDIVDYYGLDAQVRRITDYFFLKSHGMDGLPDGLKWLYGYYDPFKGIMRMPKWSFILLTSNGGIGDGCFQRPYWHKEEKEDILAELNIQVEYPSGEINQGDGNRIGDFEHADIIMARLSEKEKIGLLVSMHKLANGGVWEYKGQKVTLLRRSPSSILHEINEHNQDITAKGTCEICNRVKAKVNDQPV